MPSRLEEKEMEAIEDLESVYGSQCESCGQPKSGGTLGLDRNLGLCAACQEDPRRIAESLLRGAELGLPGLEPLKSCTLEWPLGKGGMGSVFLIRHTETGQQSALKLMLPRLSDNDTAKALFRREVAVMQALHHPNLVRIEAAGYGRGTFFFTMEHCAIGSVADVLKLPLDRRLPIAEALPIILQILDGLNHAHESGVVHRDLKPSNLLLASIGGACVAKVADLGLAKLFDEAGLSGITHTGDRFGTPEFQPRTQVVDYKYAKPWVDVWAIAATFYFMLTGTYARPFNGRERWGVVLKEEVIPIRDRDPDIPFDLAAIIDQALDEHSASPPYPTAHSLRAALETFDRILGGTTDLTSLQT